MAQSNNKRIVTNALLNTIKTVLGIIFPLVTFPYVTRVLGVEILGVYNFSASLISYFLLVAALGVSTYGIREGTQYRDDREKISRFVSEVFSINLFSTVISYILLIICLVTVPKLHNYSTVISILSIEIIMTTLGVAWVCNIYEDFLFITVRALGMQIISLILTLTMIKKPEDLNVYVAIIVLANSGSNIFNLFYIRRKYCKFRLTLHINWKRHLKPILIIFSTTVAITVYVSSDTTMLGFMTNDYQVGLYGTSVKIYTIIKSVLAAILMVLIPQFTLLFSSGDKGKSDSVFSQMFNVLTVLMLPICVGLFSLSEDVVLLISGSEYIEAASPLRLLSVAIVFSLYAYMYTQCVLIPIKEERVVFVATGISAFVNIGLNLILIPTWGINAAAVTTIIAELITFLIAFLYSRKTVKLIPFGKNLISTLIGCVCIFLICLACRAMDSLAARVVISVCGSVVAYAIVLTLLKNPVLAQLKGTILKQR